MGRVLLVGCGRDLVDVARGALAPEHDIHVVGVPLEVLQPSMSDGNTLVVVDLRRSSELSRLAIPLRKRPYGSVVGITDTAALRGVRGAVAAEGVLTDVLYRDVDDIPLLLKAHARDTAMSKTFPTAMRLVRSVWPIQCNTPLATIFDACFERRALEFLSTATGKSRWELHRSVRASTGIPPGQVVAWCRTALIVAALEGTTFSQRKIAAAVGMQDARGLRRTINRTLGRRLVELRFAGALAYAVGAFGGLINTYLRR